MVSVRLLGTGTPILDPDRCGSGTAIDVDGDWILVDCGRGVTQRVAQAGLDLTRLQAVFLTHHHSDHISDLSTLAIARWREGPLDPMVVVAPEGPCSTFANRCLDGFVDQAFYGQGPYKASLRPTTEVRPFAPTDIPAEIYVDGVFRVVSVLVDHHPIESAVGYRVEAHPAVVTVSGDTAVCPGIEQLADGASVLIHEALRGDLVPPDLLSWNASAESEVQWPVERPLTVSC